MNAAIKTYNLPADLNEVLTIERISVSPTTEKQGQGADFYAFVFDLGQEDAVNAFGATPSEAVGKVLEKLGKPVQFDTPLFQAGEVIDLAKVEQMAAYYNAPKGFFDWIDTIRNQKKV